MRAIYLDLFDENKKKIRESTKEFTVKAGMFDEFFDTNAEFMASALMSARRNRAGSMFLVEDEPLPPEPPRAPAHIGTGMDIMMDISSYERQLQSYERHIARQLEEQNRQMNAINRHDRGYTSGVSHGNQSRWITNIGRRF